MNQIRIELKPSAGGTYSGERRCGELSVQPLTGLKLGSEASMTLGKGSKRKIYQLLQDLDRAAIGKAKDGAWDEDCQFAVGTWLNGLVLGGLRDDEKRWIQGKVAGREGVSAVVITDDPHLTRLPWPLLLLDGAYVNAGPGNVSLCVDATLLSVISELPRSRKVLVAAPEPRGFEKLAGSAHLRDLAEELVQRDPNAKNPDRWREVSGWEEFGAALKNWKPDVVYYFGHGVGEPGNFHLQFQLPDGAPLPVSAMDVQALLRSGSGPRPLLMYFNCCDGGKGGHLSLGSRLGREVPALLTNRTGANRNAACRQAIVFLKKVLLDGMEPHLAAREVYSLLTDEEFMAGNPRWMNPIFHRGYGTWKATAVHRSAIDELDPHWRLKLDRTIQYAQLSHNVQEMLENPRIQRGLSFLWTGGDGAGLEEFHERLDQELPNRISGTCCVTRNVTWASELSGDLDSMDRQLVYDNMLRNAFGDVGSLDEVPALLAREAGPSAKSMLVHLRHAPTTLKRLGKDRLAEYLEYVDGFAGKLRPNQHCLLGVSYREEIEAVLEEVAGQCNCNHTMVSVLKHLSTVSVKDLTDFFGRYPFPVAPAQRKAVATDIFKKTGGEYRKIIEELEKFLMKRRQG